MVFDALTSTYYNSVQMSAFANGTNILTKAAAADLLRPSEKRLAGFYDAALISGGSLLIGLCAHAKVWLPFSPGPVTGQTFAVLMLGALLGSRLGSLAVLAYIAEGAAGLPVFAAGVGPAALLGPTGGYLFGFIPAAYITGRLAEKGWDRRVGTTILAMILGNLVIYTFGLLWLCLLTGFSTMVLTLGFYPFIISDSAKIIMAAILLPGGWKLLGFRKLAGKGE
jgi:biotin transport system substrate-specific component